MNSVPEKKAAWNTRLLYTLWELGFLPEEPRERAAPGAAAKSNLFFALSGMCWLFLYFPWGQGNLLVWSAMVLAMFFLTELTPAFHRGIRLPRWGKLLALLNALGTVGLGVRVCAGYFTAAHGTVQIADLVGLSPGLTALGISGVFGVLGLWFLYVFIARLYTALCPVLAHLFSGVHRRERAILGVLVLALAVFTAAAFSQSEAFYATEHNYDVIYTADSAYLVKGTAWLNLTFAENDLRQPLFAVFSAPFVGWAYVLTQLVPSGHWLAPWLMDLPQLGLLVLGMYMLATLLASTESGRLAVTVSLCALYPSLLFALMMEQYILAVFWLLLFVYMNVERLPGRGAALVGAAGSLLTSAAMHADIIKASNATQRLAVALSKPWVVSAYNNIVLKVRQHVPARLNFEIENWSQSMVDGSEEAALCQEADQHFTHRRDLEIAAVTQSKWDAIIPIGCGVVSLIAFIAGSPTWGIIGLIAAAGFGLRWFLNKRNCENTRENIKKLYEKIISDVKDTVRALCAERVDYINDLLARDEVSDTTAAYLEGLEVGQYVGNGDHQRNIR